MMQTSMHKPSQTLTSHTSHTQSRWLVVSPVRQLLYSLPCKEVNLPLPCTLPFSEKMLHSKNELPESTVQENAKKIDLVLEIFVLDYGTVIKHITYCLE